MCVLCIKIPNLTRKKTGEIIVTFCTLKIKMNTILSAKNWSGLCFLLKNSTLANFGKKNKTVSKCMLFLH